MTFAPWGLGSFLAVAALLLLLFLLIFNGLTLHWIVAVLALLAVSRVVA